MSRKIRAAAVTVGAIAAITAGTAFAAHPLITDDTGTQGKGRFQIEVNGETGSDTDASEGVTVKESVSELGATLSWGVTENADIVVGIPRQAYTVKEDGATTVSESGLSDLSLEYKHRFFEHEGLSVAVKPGITLPTGDEDRGLGAGKPSYGIVFITSKEAGPITMHVNLGYAYTDAEADRKGIWHASLAAESEVAMDLKAVANIGVEQNPEIESAANPAFLLGGVIYSLSDNVDVDAGVKVGLNDAETDSTILAGVAVRF